MTPLQQLSQFGFKINIAAGKRLFKQGDLAQTMFFIEEGEVLIEGNKGNFSKHLYDGDHFGELAMVVKNHVRSASATTLTDTSVIVIDQSIYDDVATKLPSITIGILEGITNSLYNSEQNLLTQLLNTKSQETPSLQKTRTEVFEHQPDENSSFLNIKGYKLTRLLGKGSYAEVYLARKDATNEELALKIFDLTASNSQDVYQHYFSELEVLSELDHPNICKIIDHCVTDDYVYTVQKFYDTGTLYEQIAHKAMGVERVYDYFTTIIAALEYLHLNGVVYKDLKSQNILTSSDGDLVLADFGSSNLPDNHTQDHTGFVMLSPYYMSPEQSRNHELDYLTDYYSLGILLYEMLTGTKPFVRPSLKEMVKAHRSENTPRLPRQSRVFQRLLDTLTQKSKYDRCQSVKEIKKHMTVIRKYLDKQKQQ